MTGQALADRTRVMLVDDHPDFRDLMVEVLRRQPDLQVVAQAGSMAEARGKARASNLDVVILDLGLPDGNGADLIPELRGIYPEVAVLVLSASLHHANIEKAMRAGASEVLDKLATPGEVVGTVRRLTNA